MSINVIPLARRFGALALFFPLLPTGLANARCLDISPETTLTVTGDLARPIFPGPPNYTDVREGDAPEPAYILTLDEPFCVNEEFLGDNVMVETIHLIDVPESARGLIGQMVSLSGRDLFGAHTGHHHAPLLMTVHSIETVEQDSSSGRTTVEAFYLALETGDGEAAAMNVVPEKRANGPLSASALSAFYGNLKRPLRLLDVAEIGSREFRATYHFATSSSVCNGAAIVTTRQVGSLNLISGIRAENAC